LSHATISEMKPTLEDLKKDQRILREYRALIRSANPEMDKAEMSLIKRSFNLALEACVGQREKLGELTIFHALGVARIVVDEMRLGIQSVVSALLFDFIIDKTIGIEDIQEVFPEDIIKIISGLDKISGIDTHRSNDQGENFRSLLVTMSSDIRVILVQLADRLYHMRKLDCIGKAGKKRISAEVSFIYAPLAHRLGFYNIKEELEDLTLKYNDSKAYQHITDKLQETKVARDRFIREFVKPLKGELDDQGFKFEIKARTKSVHSIWSKMNRQNVDFEEVYDIFAVRIIINSNEKKEKADCWKVYSIVTDFYQPNPNRLRDWISIPKSNGYESLHTTVVVPGGRWVEVQIRSGRMHEIAEMGLAAHWKYKGGTEKEELEEWMNRIREIFENPEPEMDEIIDDFKLSLYNKEIFVFTPKGDLKKFPVGATILDFAFDVHTDVGSSCMGARVNGRSVPIRHELSNGDKVEIMTSKNQKPKQDWLQFVISTKAKSKIRQALQEQTLAQADAGRDILRRRFKNWKIEFEDQNINKLLRHYKFKNATDLYSQVAKEKIDILEIKELLTGEDKDIRTKEPDRIEEELVEKMVGPGIKQDDYLVIDDQLDKVEYKLSKCCNPIFGDDIFGFVTIGSGITVHRVNCPNAAQMISRYGYRVVKAQWSETEKQVYLPASIRITGIDDMGILSRISDAISKDLKVNMRSVSIDSNEGMFEGSITLFVKDTGHLDVLIKRLAKIKGVLSVSRLDQ